MKKNFLKKNWKINLPEASQNGQNMAFENLAKNNIARYMKKIFCRYRDISEISYDSRGIRLISAANGTTVLLGLEDEALVNCLILETFIEDSSNGVISPYEYIDLRFHGQVIVKERG